MNNLNIWPVIHYKNDELMIKNAEMVFAYPEIKGIFLIQHNCKNLLLIPAIIKLKELFPDRKIGVNWLGEKMSYLYENGLSDMSWSDDGELVHSETLISDFHREILQKNKKLWKVFNHDIFMACAFKYQKIEPHPDLSALICLGFGFIPCTSGDGTGEACGIEKLHIIRKAIGNNRLAVASGITPENIQDYLPYVTDILVATGISKNFHEFDQDKVDKLVTNTYNLF